MWLDQEEFPKNPLAVEEVGNNLEVNGGREASSNEYSTSRTLQTHLNPPTIPTTAKSPLPFGFCLF